MSDAEKLKKRAIESQADKLSSRTRLISIDQDEEVFIPKTKYPLVYEQNMRLFGDIESFFNDNKLYKIETAKNEKILWEASGIFLSRLDFINIKKMLNIFDDVRNDINDINNGVINKSQVTQPSNKVNQLKKLYEKYNMN